ncbi:glycine cleavage system protein R [Pleionea sediminis]|uniref:glycine cleavage system protein R n=1 Tax=Pleionea sediminis TaxID=2569479 RepID=UPI00118586B2|nr:ACT domain-containing protein [Pleionea sediminis]
MKMKLLISVFGKDRPGLVKRISDSVRTQGGNWLESRLSHLGGKFSGLVLAEFEQSNVEQAKSELLQLSDDQLDVLVEASVEPLDGELVKVQLVGNDKTGIVYEIADALNQLNANVEKMDSQIEPAPMSGGELFKAKLLVKLPSGLNFSDVKEKLESLADDLMVDLIID